MTSYYFSKTISVLTLLILSCQAYADQWYHVELIVFEQLNTVTDEQWPQMTSIDDAILTPDMATVLIQPDQTETLAGAAKRLQRSPRYQVLYHQAWQQAIMTKRNAQAVKIHSADNSVNGNIRLYKSTYLHAALNVWLMQNPQQLNSWSDISPEGVDINAPRNPNLHESRRIRSKKLAFFDHPKMGALLQITPIETPDTAQIDIEQLETLILPTEPEATVSE